MKFFNLDCHIGSRDIQQIFQNLGHTMDIWSISNHCKLMGWERKNVDVINEKSWFFINPDLCNIFYERYKNELKDYDAFVTFYPPAFSLLYEKFNKPIIMQVPIRFEVPFHDDYNMWNNFNNYLKSRIDSGMIIPLTNNLYDSYYLELFTQRKWEVISSLCEYTNAKYTGKSNDVLYCSKNKDLINFIRYPRIVNKADLKDHSWQDVADYRAIVYFPYHNTLMSIFEQYTANIPLLFPTKRFLVQLWKQYKKIMAEISWNQLGKIESRTILGVEGLDPNNYKSIESFAFWSSLSDFYDIERFPYIQYFDSIVDLEDKLYSLDFSIISGKMKEFNMIRRERIYNQWKNVLKRI